MPTADEIFAQLSENVSEHTHSVVDSDSYFVIDPISREVTNNSLERNVLMQYDHDSERYTFELPRIVEGHNMMLCNVVKVHYNNIDSETKDENAGVYDVTDLRVDPSDSSKVICSWLISREATAYAGSLSFLVQYMCTDSDGNVVYEWHSDIYSDIEVRVSRDNGESIITPHTDLLEQWRAKLFGVEDSATANIVSASETQQAEIAAKGAETLATIPEDYTTTHNMADKALRKKSDAILVTETDERISLDDSSDCNLVGLNVYGKTIQHSTTGKNLLDVTLTSRSESGLVITVYDDGKITIFGKSTGGAIDLQSNLVLKPGTYTFSVGSKLTVPDSNGIWVYGGGGAVQAFLRNMNKITFEVTEETSVKVYLFPTKDATWDVTIYPQIESGSEATSYEKYSGGYASPSPQYSQELKSTTNPKLTIKGKNILNGSLFPKTSTSLGITSEYEGDGVFHIYGTHTGAGDSIILSSTNLYIPAVVGKNYTLSVKLLEGNCPVNFHPFLGCGNATTTYGNWFSVYVTDTMKAGETRYDTHLITSYTHTATHITRFWIYNYNGDLTKYSVDFRIKVWLEEGDTSTDYVTYDEQTLTLSKPLRGIPVSENGNYTDSNGQQWVCDEIDFERGKYIQRVKELNVSEFTTWSTWGPNYHKEGYTGFYHYNDYDTDTVYKILVSNALCTAFPYSIASWGGRDVGCSAATDYIQISVSNDYLSDISSNEAAIQSFKSLIASRDVKMLVVIKPIETDLTSAEMEAFRALHTNATNTTILNDQNATMNVKYVADVKRYIYKNCNVKRKFDLTLPVSKWVGYDNDTYYSQVVDLDVGEDVKIDLHPTAQQLISLLQDGISMFVANENGVVTVYSVGGAPGTDITIRVTETVVYYE